MAPKNKGTKVKLGDFLADETTGKVDWAEDIDDLHLAPLPPRGDDRGGPRRGSDWLTSQPDRGDRDRLNDSDRGFDRGPPRQELPLPTAPPYTAFIGNLSFDVREPEVEDFFAPSKCTSVRMVNGADGRAKGFGYVEFETLDGLKDALSRSGSQWMGRTVRVSVAEPRDARAGGSSAAEEASQWRRAGPLPSVEGPSAARRNDRPGFGRQESSGGGFDSMENRSGFGARFTPSTPRDLQQQQQPARRPMMESMEPSQGDNASDWRTGKPVREQMAASPSPRRPSDSPGTPMGGDGQRAGPMRGPRGDATEVDERFSSQDRLGFGSKFQPTPPESPSMAKRPGFGFDRRNSNAPAGSAGPSGGPGEDAETWRSSTRKGGEGGGSPAPAAPAQRKKLELKPRSAVAAGGAEGSTESSVSTSGKANPFGLAKPIDMAEREREIEAKLAAQDKERKGEEKKRKDKLRTDREKAQAQAPTGPRADRNRSRGPTSEKGSESSSTPAVSVSAGDADAAPSPSLASPLVAKQAPPTGAWGGGRKPSGALVSGEQSPVAKGEREEGVNGSVADEAVNGNGGGVEAAEVQKAVESLQLAE